MVIGACPEQFCVLVKSELLIH
ncbi:hypothetical protein LMED105_07303 [Limnobacter sp. MED105]|nr:hypothetical protein LMED105_07303 [Limnobacter sp. MED105]